MRTQWSAPLIGLLFCAAGAVTAAPESDAPLPPAAAAKAGSSPFTGRWMGVYYADPNVMALQVEFHSAPGGLVTGELKYFPAKAERNALGQPIGGSYRVNGHYEDASRTFTLKPGAWIDKPDMPGLQVPMLGVYDARSNQLAGTFDFKSAANPTFFVLAAEEQGDQLIAEVVHSAYPDPPTRTQMNQAEQARIRDKLTSALARMPNSADPATYPAVRRQLAAATAAAGDDGLGGWQAPPLDQLVDWASRLKQEMPALNLGATTMEKVYRPARNLFEDGYFQQHFGITFEQMNTAQRKAAAGVLAQPVPGLVGYGFLSHPFRLGGDFGAMDLTVSIYWQRVLRSWLRELPANLSAMAAELSSFSHLAFAETAGSAEVPFLWPSERDAWRTALAGARARLAGPVLTLEADRLISAATSDAGARALAAWRPREKDILPYAAEEDRNALQRRIDARLDDMLAQLLVPSLDALAALGRGLDAVEAGNLWWRRLAQSFDYAMLRPPLEAATRQFEAVRSRDLAEAQPAIIAQLDAAVQDTQIQYLLSRYLACPGDNLTAAAAEIRRHAHQRVATVQHQEFMGTFSAYEKSLMDPPQSGHLNLSKSDEYRQPGPDEVRLALLRGMAGGTGEVLSPYTARVSSLLGAGSMIVKIADLRILKWVKNGDIFEILYRANLHFSVPSSDPLRDADPNLRQAAQMAVTTANATAELTSAADNYVEVRLYPSGWGVPALRQEGAGRAGIDSMLRGMVHHQ